MLTQKIQQDQIVAMKAKDSVKTQTLRFILAQIKNKEVDKQSALTDEETIDVLRKFVRELQESITAFEKGNRTDLAEESKVQLQIVQAYLPPEISDADLEKEIKMLVEKNKAMYEKNPKSIIGICIRELKNKADSSRILKIINSITAT